jgi:hypothetical protein
MYLHVKSDPPIRRSGGAVIRTSQREAPPAALADNPNRSNLMPRRLMRVPLLMACLVAPSACASSRAATVAQSADDVAQAYVAAVRHSSPGTDRGYALDPVVWVLYEETRLASDPPDSIPHPPEVLSRLLASGLFSGMCQAMRATYEPACPEGARVRVLFSEPLRVSADTVEFEVAYAKVLRPDDVIRGYAISYWYRVVRVRGAWTVAETRQRSVT